MAEGPSDFTWSLTEAAHALAEHPFTVERRPAAIPAWENLRLAGRWLRAARSACAEVPPEASKAAEWLLDNDYQMHRAIRQIAQDLPRSFYARLPALADPEEPAFPRVFALAHELLRVTQMQVSLASATAFVNAYQERQPLMIAELWALPTMLRIACLEITVSALTPMLHDVTFPFAPSAWGSNPHSLDETGRVARGIANLGLIAALSWEDFFDATSVVEAKLRSDPSSYYSKCDFETRDRCRRAVEEMARHGPNSEWQVADEALRLSEAAEQSDGGGHVGHWLIGVRRPLFERLVNARLPLRRRFLDFVLRHPGPVYTAALTLCGIAAMVAPAIYLLLVGASFIQWLAGLAIAFVPASILAVSFTHWATTQTLPPRILAKLDYRKGLPNDCATVVAMPVLVARKSDVAGIIEQAEMHWLANSDPMLRIAVLADLADAQEEHTDGDEPIIRALEAQLTALNKRYGRQKPGPFHLMIRPRLYNPAEGCWMAWERKRGKLERFNRLLLEGDDSAFSLWIGHRSDLENVRFVVTVDADTLLPAESVGRLVGTLAHPLNRARFDQATGRIVSGYSIIQPRTETSPQSGMRSLFSRLFTGDTAIDIYSRAVSDVYQDLFGTGIFVGKGIYDVGAFHRSVDGRVPDNSILSHDLFEGAHGRTGLATDIVLYESFPATYLEYARRLHRWIRGDWQLLPWLRRSVSSADGQRLESAFAGPDRWKILDNLRRSLVAPSLLVLALAGWFFLPGASWFWTLLAVFAPAGQLFTDLVSGLARGRRRGTARRLPAQLSDQVGRWLLAIVYLLHEALLSLHAISVTLWRLSVSRRHLLEWTSAAQVASAIGSGTRRAIWQQMGTGPAVASATTLLLVMLQPSALPAAAPLLLVWIAAPEITFWIGQPRRDKTVPLRSRDVPFLRALARRTWLYFETFAGPEDHWLPPDNYQGEPHQEVAYRTSPTNIGMMLLSTATAWDLGYIGRSELAARTENVFDTLDRLEGHRGHLLNWYDTRTLEPLEPRYVSTVDSGNLAVSLIAYAAALEDAASSSALEPQRWQGLDDVLGLLLEAGGQIAADRLVPTLNELRKRIAELSRDPSTWLFGLSQVCDDDIPAIEFSATEAIGAAPAMKTGLAREFHAWLDRLRHQATAMLRDLGQAQSAIASLPLLARRAENLANGMDFQILYDSERKLLVIGHNLSSPATDGHYYDLLASEARLASLFAVAKRDVPVEHWFYLDRPVTRVDGEVSLLSWSGSMFEYLMPRLLLRPGPDTLLGRSERAAVSAHRRYGEATGVPWGMSESAFAERDPHHRFRYRAFGVPELGLRRGLARDLVVTPYASALALAVAPGDAVANLKALDRLGATGLYGLIEALDFTPGRVQGSEPFTPVNAWMAHHQGMILCAIGNALTKEVHVRRFARDLRFRLASLLLSERVPHEIPSAIEGAFEMEREAVVYTTAKIPPPWEPDLSAQFPEVALLGNGRLASWISHSGGGSLRWRGQALTRFGADSTRDADGVWIYMVDCDTGALWSATGQPTQAAAVESRALFHAHKAEFHRREGGLNTRLEVCVAAGDDVELRKLVIFNETDRPRRLRVTSYGEIVLASSFDDERHPAFSKLFVESESVPHLGALLFSRRTRGPRETPPFLLHFLVGTNGPVIDVRWETDRSAFLGRGNDPRAPLGATGPLQNGAGFTLDPVMAVQYDVELNPYENCELCFVTVAAPTREAAIEVGERYATLAAFEWTEADAASDVARAVERAGIEPESLPTLSQLASQLVYPHGSLRTRVETTASARVEQSQLWGFGLSGDLPILVVRASAGSSLPLQIVRARLYWRRQGLEFDLVVVQAGSSAYFEPIRTDVEELLRASGASDMLGRRGGVHLLFSDQLGAAQVELVEASARAVLDDRKELHVQLEPASKSAELPLITPSLPPDRDLATPALPRRQDLLADNGHGGFSPDGREYVIHLEPGESTPAPWANVLANEHFGTLVTESGGGYSWAVNSGENRLTPWTNDPVTDRPVEILYLRDEETAAIWTVTPAPSGRDVACEIRHGPGYTCWRKQSCGLEQEMVVLVPVNAPVKLVRLRLRNLWDRYRRITSTFYVEWLLGALPSLSRPHVVCGQDADTNALLATSNWSSDFAGRVAFLAASRPPHGFTTDRREFLGPNGHGDRPAGLLRWGLSGRIVAGEDPCAAYQVHHDIEPNGTHEVIFVLGQGADEDSASALAKRWAQPGAFADAFEAVKGQWDGILSAVEVHTPDPAFDLLVNRWLIYQCLSARVLGRTGFYQSSGAFGFRDQIQDVLALLHAQPERARAHILECAAHQFEEGDVLHWWHPPSDRGVRTRCSDDLVWLPYAAATYVSATGDESILHEAVPFLRGAPLGPDEDDRYAQFVRGGDTAPLIDHMERALERAMTEGAHGLPLIGAGDWNDGMNRVGHAAHGESVWLGWFLAVTAELTADMQGRLGRDAKAVRWRGIAADLRGRVEGAGWDGEWYRRAYYDDGHPLGSAAESECRIDSIAQSWAVFAGAQPDRIEIALQSALHELAGARHGVVRLLWPPFDKGPRDPGYIKAYPPGIRENGGQYSHAAAWLGLALAKTGNGGAAHAIFSMINPIERPVSQYRVEPYVVAGDIAAAEPHVGRGGWTWYTGAAGWTWRLAVEGILGLELRDNGLLIEPRLPPHWDGFEAVLRRDQGSVVIKVERDTSLIGIVSLMVDGEKWPGDAIPFPVDGGERRVLAKVGPATNL